jgi:transcriptional regulator with XRE-family HTH domain
VLICPFVGYAHARWLYKGKHSMTPLRKRFGRRLKQLRLYKEITQEELAEMIGVTNEFISNIERGKSAPSFETIDKLAEALNVSVMDMFNFEDLRSDRP